MFFFGKKYFKFLPDAWLPVQFLTFDSRSLVFSGHQKMTASITLLVFLEWPKCRIIESRLLRFIDTTI